MPILIEAAQDNESAVRDQALTVLLEMSPRPPAAAGAFAKGLKATDLVLRVKAADALADFEGRTAEVIPVLVEAAKQANPAVRTQALATLGRLGPKAKNAAARLVGTDAQQSGTRRSPPRGDGCADGAGSDWAAGSDGKREEERRGFADFGQDGTGGGQAVIAAAEP